MHYRAFYLTCKLSKGDNHLWHSYTNLIFSCFYRISFRSKTSGVKECVNLFIWGIVFLSTAREIHTHTYTNTSHTLQNQYIHDSSIFLPSSESCLLLFWEEMIFKFLLIIMLLTQFQHFVLFFVNICFATYWRHITDNTITNLTHCFQSSIVFLLYFLYTGIRKWRNNTSFTKI